MINCKWKIWSYTINSTKKIKKRKKNYCIRINDMNSPALGEFY